jgi:hypothetical protein
LREVMASCAVMVTGKANKARVRAMRRVMLCCLTTPHKLQGRGPLGKPRPYWEGLSQVYEDRWPRPGSFMR